MNKMLFGAAVAAGMCSIAGAVPAQNLPQNEPDGARVAATVQRKTEAFLLVRRADGDAVLAVRAGNPPTDAVLVAPRPDRTIVAISAAADGLYVLTRDADGDRLLRLAARSVGGTEIGFAKPAPLACRNCRSFPALRRNTVQDIRLPRAGAVAVVADASAPGVIVAWPEGAGAVRLRYDPSSGRFVRL